MRVRHPVLSLVALGFASVLGAPIAAFFKQFTGQP